jgi:ABC-type multidrug transport system permease subunit
MVTWGAFSAVVVLILILAFITVIVVKKVRRKGSRI